MVVTPVRWLIVSLVAASALTIAPLVSTSAGTPATCLPRYEPKFEKTA